MRKNLLYFVIFGNQNKGAWFPDDYLEQLRLCLHSLRKTSNLEAFDVVFLADEEKARGIRKLPEVSGLCYQIHVFTAPPELTRAMCTRFRIFEFLGETSDRYEKILYLDIDIVFFKDVAIIFDGLVDPNLVYVKTEHWNGTRVNSPWFALPIHSEEEARAFVEKDVKAFNSGSFGFVNGPVMRELFAELVRVSDELVPIAGRYTDQPIMNSFLRSRHLVRPCLDHALLDPIVHVEGDKEGPRPEQTVLVHFIKSNKLVRMKEEVGALPTSAPAVAPMAKQDSAVNTLFNQAQQHHKNGKLHEAEQFYQRCLAKDAKHAGALSYLGYVLYQTNRDIEALPFLDRALVAAPRNADAHAWRGLVLFRLNRLDEAVAANRAAIKINPKHMGAHHNLGMLLVQQKQYSQAIPHLKQGIELGFRRPEPFILLARAHTGTGKLLDAEKAYRDALKLDPKHVDAHIGLSNVLYDLGEHDAGIAEVRKAVESNPKALGGQSNYAMKLLYHGELDPEMVAGAQKAAGKAYFDQYGAAGPIWRPRDLNPERKLRIGYLSPDLYQHATAFFLEGVFAAHDPANVEVYCYSNSEIQDALSEQLKRLVHLYRDISRMDYRQAAALIAEDEIDILIDCAGHTRGNRLDVLALKPAPLQGTWIGYPHGTGLATMDFRLTDELADPPGMTDGHYVEKLVRLPEGTFCYKAPGDVPLPAPGPLERGEGPVFGCYNNPQKIGRRVVKLWASIVSSVPGARLRLKARQYLDAGAADRYRKRFIEAGILPSKLEIEGRGTFKEGFAEYANIDVALDPFPYHGTTSTCEALWMGAPVVVLPGKTCVSRVGASLLHRVDLDDLVARDEAHYREIAINLINDRARLAELRQTLRQRLVESSLGNGRKFVPHLENALRDLWRDFCRQHSHAATNLAAEVETPMAETGSWVQWGDAPTATIESLEAAIESPDVAMEVPVGVMEAPAAKIEAPVQTEQMQAVKVEGSSSLKIEAISSPRVKASTPTNSVIEVFRAQPKAVPEPAFLSLITTCRGRLAHLKQSLPTFVAQRHVEIIVVDYDCPQKTADWVEAQFRQVKVVREVNRPRFELSRARNAGAAVATAPWLCFVDADVCLMPDFATRLRDILKEGHYYQALPRTIETWGTSISSRADFERVGGYDEILQGWGKDDDDYYARLEFEGLQHANFPGELIRALQHGDDARVENYELKDRWVNESINHVYCQAKLDWMLLRRAPLDIETRQELYRSVHAAVLDARRDGGSLELKIPIMTRETRACGMMEVRLSYTLPNPRGTGMPANNAASLRKR